MTQPRKNQQNLIERMPKIVWQKFDPLRVCARVNCFNKYKPKSIGFEKLILNVNIITLE